MSGATANEPKLSAPAAVAAAAKTMTFSSLFSSSSSKVLSRLANTATKVWQPSEAHVRWNTSLRPPPEVWPLVGAMAAGMTFVGIIVYHELARSPTPAHSLSHARSIVRSIVRRILCRREEEGLKQADEFYFLSLRMRR